MNLYTQVQLSIQENYAAFLEYTQKRYVKESLIVIGMFVIVAGGYFGFQWYQKRQNIAAFAGLVEIAKAYETASSKARELKNKPAEEQTENPWEDTQLLLEAISSAHSSSSLSPFFVMYQAQLALEAEGNYDKACDLMEKGIRRISKKSPFYDMFNIKRIKMLLDSPMQNVREKAVQELQQVADNVNNYYAQEALWTLGAYQSHQGNLTAAIEAWKKLAQEGQSEKALISSPWVIGAQDKLKSLHVEVALNN